jgi:predicted RND superfamily exporter protein
MLEKFLEKSKILLYKKKHVIFIAALFTIISIPGILLIKFDNELINMIPENNLDRKNNSKYEKIFGDNSAIYVALENNKIFDKDFLNYIKELTEKIKNLNNKLPKQNLAKLFNVSENEAEKIISIISETGAFDGNELKKILIDKEKLKNEYFLENEIAEMVSKKSKNVKAEEILNAYTLPVKDVISILNVDIIKGEKDKFKVEKSFEGEEVKEKDIIKIKDKIKSWNFYNGFLLSEDETITAILIQLNNVGLGIKGQVYEEILKIIKDSPYKVYVGGDTVVTYSINKYMVNDLLILIPLVAIVVVVVLYLSFKNLEGVFYPLISVALSAIWTVGFMSYLNVPFNVVSIVIPVLLIAVGSAYGIHFMNSYFFSKKSEKIEIFKDNLTSIGISISLAGLTTIAGFGSLLTSGFKPLKNFGIFTSLGVFLAMIVSLYLIPALLLFGKKEKDIFMKEEKRKDIIHNILNLFEKVSITKSKTTIAISIFLCVIFIFGIFKIRAEMNGVEFFRKDAEVRIVDDFLNKKLTGTQNIDIIFEKKDGNSILKYNILYEIEKFNKNIKTKFSQVQKIISLNEYLKKMNQEMMGGDERNYVLPETDEKINDYMLLYSGKLDSVVTQNKDMTRVTFVLKRMPTMEIEKIKNYILKYFKNDFLKENNLEMKIAGYANLYVVANKLITNSMIYSMLSSLLIVFFINLYSFKSLKITILSLLPICITLIISLGIMGYFNIPLNAGTAMIAAVAIGIGIDYPIHFLTRYLKEKRKNGKEVAIGMAVNEIGRGIVYNILSVASGFFILAFSKFIPLVQFGGMICFIMFLTGVGALLFLPACLMKFD